MIKTALKLLLLLLVTLLTVIALNTWRKGSRQMQVPPLAPVAVDEAGAASRLAEAVRFKTLSSREDATLNADQFKALHALLQARFPKLHATLKREVVNELSLLYTWEGTDPKAQPIMLMAHQDVVPIAPGTEGDWQVPPFAGQVRDGFVWGRGSWDDKGNLMSQLEAVEMLLASGYRPTRTATLSMCVVTRTAPICQTVWPEWPLAWYRWPATWRPTPTSVFRRRFLAICAGLNLTTCRSWGRLRLILS